MQKLIVAALLAVPLGCAHRHDAHNLAQRQATPPPRGDFENGTRDRDSRDRANPPAEPPIVTPPIP